METPLCSDDGGPTGPFSMLLPREEISQSDLILVFMQIILILPINPTDFTWVVPWGLEHDPQTDLGITWAIASGYIPEQLCQVIPKSDK